MMLTTGQFLLLLTAGLFLLLLLIAGILWALDRNQTEQLLARAGLPYIDQMEHFDVDGYLLGLFRGLGYRVERVEEPEQKGADLILTDGTGRRVAVLSRHFRERVPEQAMQDLVTGAAELDCQERLVATVAGFTGRARQLAQQTGTHLWDLKRLAEAAQRAREAAAEARADRARPLVLTDLRPGGGEPEPVAPSPIAAGGPVCPVCGSAMQPRIALGREIWVCVRFPRCNGARERE